MLESVLLAFLSYHQDGQDQFFLDLDVIIAHYFLTSSVIDFFYNNNMRMTNGTMEVRKSITCILILLV